MADIKIKDVIMFLSNHLTDLYLTKQHRSNTIILKRTLKRISPTASNNTQYNSGDPLFIVISIKTFMKTSQNIPNQTSFFNQTDRQIINLKPLPILAISPKF